MKKLLILGLLVLGGCDRSEHRLPLLSATAETPAPIIPSGPRTKHLFVLDGQSNMVGKSPSSFPSHAGVNVVGGEARGAGVWATYCISDKHPDWDIVALKVAVGGQPISYFVPGTAQYQDMVQQTKSYVDQGYTLEGFFFYQGESDAINGTVAGWSSAFSLLIDSFRIEFGNVPVVYVQVGDYSQDLGSAMQQNWSDLRALQASITLARGAYVTAIGQPLRDGIHLEISGYQNVGSLMANKWASL